MDTLANLVEQYKAGTFDPTQWNWCVGENIVPVDGDPTGPTGFRPAVCIFVMGDGAQQCYRMIPLDGVPSPELWEQAISDIKRLFGVKRVIRGVG
jgi:hypothetical protein